MSLSRIAGSLYGLLVGDALGCPVETWTPARIQKVFGGVLTEMRESQEGKRWRPLGLHSDDGQQALALFEAYLTSPMETVPQTFIATLVQMANGKSGSGYYGAHRGTGRNFRATVALLAQGKTWEAAQPSAGNGNAMMIAPVAWMGLRGDSLAKEVVRISRIKQKDVRGIAAAGAVAYLVGHAIDKGSFSNLDSADFLGFVEKVETEFSAQTGDGNHMRVVSTMLRGLLQRIHGNPNQVYDWIAAEAGRTSERVAGCAAGYAPASVTTAIFCALKSTSFENALVEVVNLGGDADTTGAICGAISGAVYGLENIPDRWLDKLIAKDSFDAHILALCSGLAGSWHPQMALCHMERIWTKLLTNRSF